MGVQTVGKEIQKVKQSSGNMSQEETNNKNKWVKLTGPGAELLAEAYLGPAVVVLQEIMGVRGSAKQVTAEEENTNSAMEKEECIIKRAIRETMQIPSGQEEEEEEERGCPQVTGKDNTAEVKPVSVSPTRIVMAGTAGAGKNIKVLKSYRIVLLGNIGAGKSSLANTIFGEDVFKINHTLICQAESKSVHGRRLTVIDAPGFFDTDRPKEEMKQEIVRCITECAPGPHVFLIVLKVETFTGKEQDNITEILAYFSEESFKYAAVVFTHGDELPEGMKIEEFVEQDKCLSDLVKKCSGRCHVVDNKYWKNNQQGDYRSNQFQVPKLLNTIDKVVMENKGGCYTNKMLQSVKTETEENAKMTLAENMPQDTSNEANNSVSTNVWLKLTGPAAESLAEAFFGPSIIVFQERGGTTKVPAEVIAAEEDHTIEAGNKAETERENEEGVPVEEGKEEHDATEADDKEATETEEKGENKEEEGEDAPKKPKKKNVVKKAKQGGQAPVSAGSGNIISGIFGFILGIGAAVGSAFSAAAFSAAAFSTTVVGSAVATIGAGAAKIVSTALALLRVCGTVGKVLGLYKIFTAIWGAWKWVKQIMNTCKDFIKYMQQHKGTILLVVVFCSLLLLSFCVRVPVAGTLLLMFGVLLLILLSVVLFMLL